MTQTQELALGTNAFLFDTDGPDSCKLLANASQSNQDADVLGKACDNCPETTNPDQLDRGSDVDIVDITRARRRLVGLEPEIDPSLP